MDKKPVPHLSLQPGTKYVRANKPVPHLSVTDAAPRSVPGTTTVQGNSAGTPSLTVQNIVPGQSENAPPSSVLGSGVRIARPDRLQGLYVVGVQGTGKSTLLENLIIQDIEQGLGICLIEPHGDITQHVLARIPPQREKDIVYLDLMQTDYAFGLNLFDCADPFDVATVEYTKSFVVHIFEKLLGAGVVTQQLNQILRNVTYTLIDNPGTTFLEIPILLQDTDSDSKATKKRNVVREKLAANVKNPHVRRFWKHYERLSDRTRSEIISSMINRVDAFAASPLLQNIIGQSTTSIDFSHIMNTGKILLIQLPPRSEDIANLVGSVIIGKLLDAAYARTAILEADRQQFHIYADEFQRFAVEDFATFFAEARKFKVGLTVAHQFRGQLDEKNRGATLTVANMVVFRVTPQDAPELAARFDITPEEAWEEELEEESVEVLEEEWTEKIEDEVIDGEEPIKTLSPNPVEYLRNHPHGNPLVDAAAARLIPQLYTALSLLDSNGNYKKSDRWFSSKQYGSWCLTMEASRNQLTTGIHQLTDLLLHAMQKRIDYNQTGKFSSQVAEFVIILRGYFGLESGVPDDYKFIETRLTDTDKEYYKEFFRWLTDEILFMPFPGGLLEMVKDRIKETARDKAFVDYLLSKREDEYRHSLNRLNPPRSQFSSGIGYVRFSEEERVNHKREIKDTLAETAADVWTLIQLCLLLGKEPILVSSGTMVPRKRTQVHYITHPRQSLTHPRVAITHPQRTYQDVLNGIASDLTRLPNFQAKVILGAQEYTIITDRPKQGLGEKELQERKIRIREDNLKEKYIRAKSEVEGEIERRQSEFESRTPLTGQTTSDEEEE